MKLLYNNFVPKMGWDIMNLLLCFDPCMEQFFVRWLIPNGAFRPQFCRGVFVHLSFGLVLVLTSHYIGEHYIHVQFIHMISLRTDFQSNPCFSIQTNLQFSIKVVLTKYYLDRAKTQDPLTLIDLNRSHTLKTQFQSCFQNLFNL